MGDIKYIKILEEYLSKCSKEELAKAFDIIDKKIIDYIAKGDWLSGVNRL